MKMTLNWVKVSDTQGYDIFYRRRNASSWSQFGSRLAASAITVTIPSLEYNLLYDFKVVSICPDGKESPSQPITHAGLKALFFTLTAEDTKIKVDFTHLGGDINRYNVKLTNISGSNVISTVSKDVTSASTNVTHTFTGLTSATVYGVIIETVAATVTKTSDLKTIETTATAVDNTTVWANISDVTYSPSQTANQIVLNFKTTQPNSTIRVDVTGNLAATADPIDPPSEGWAMWPIVLETGAPGSYSLPITGITDTDPRMFRSLQMGSGKAMSSWKLFGPMATNGVATGSPVNAPTGLSITALTSALKLNWVDNSPDETGFVIYRGNSQSSMTSYTQVAAGVTTYTDNSVVRGSTYYYEVYAVKSGSMSTKSNTVNAGLPNTGEPVQSEVYFMSDAENNARSYNPDNYFTRKDYSKELSPFHSTKFLNQLGMTLGKPNRTNFGYGVIDGLYKDNYGSTTEEEWWSVVPIAKRYREISQNGTTVMGHPYGEKMTDPNAIGHGQKFQTVDGEVTVNLVRQGGETDADYNFFLPDLSQVNDLGASYNYNYIRWDAEHLPFGYSYRKQWLARRNAWEAGKYRTRANGGTNAEWRDVSDEQWLEKLFDRGAMYGISFFKSAYDRIVARGDQPWLTCYGSFGEEGSAIWNRQVSINGVAQKTIAYYNTVAHARDLVCGAYVLKVTYASSQEDNMKYAGMDYARTKQPTANTVTGVANYYRMTQVNDLNSANPQMRIRLEDENGNLVRNKDSVPYKAYLVYRAADGSPAAEQIEFLRSEGDQNPDITFTVNKAVNVAHWKIYSNMGYTEDWSIAECLRRVFQERPYDGKWTVAQFYPYTIQNCTYMWETGAGQCEANATAAVTARMFVALWATRQPEKWKTVIWQADKGENYATVGPEAGYKSVFGANASLNTYRALQVFDNYKDLYAENSNYRAVPFEISYNDGVTWISHANYINTIAEINSDNKKAAVQITWNSTQNKGLITGTPLYTDQISVKVRFTVNGAQQTQSLALNKALPEGYYFQRI